MLFRFLSFSWIASFLAKTQSAAKEIPVTARGGRDRGED